MTSEQFISQVESSHKSFRRFMVALCCGDSALADDLAQEAYIKAYLSCDSLNDYNKFNAWLHTIGYNTYLNHRRSRTVDVGYDEIQNLASGDSGDASFAYQDLYEALNRLPAKERMSVLLFYMENYSIKEIAEIEGTSPDAVKQHLARGRNHLRGLLADNY